MSTGYGWEGLRQVCATLLGARHVPERPCGGLVYMGRYNKCSPFYLNLTNTKNTNVQFLCSVQVTRVGTVCPPHPL